MASIVHRVGISKGTPLAPTSIAILFARDDDPTTQHKAATIDGLDHVASDRHKSAWTYRDGTGRLRTTAHNRPLAHGVIVSTV